jgi:hypothetical protein
MKLLMKYELDFREFWRIEQFWWDKATLSDFDTIFFYGDLILRCEGADLGYRNIPLLGFAYYFTQGFHECVRGGEACVYYTDEADDCISMHKISGSCILLVASHVSCSCQVPEEDLREALANANQQLIGEILGRFPFFSKHPIFNNIARVLTSV